MNNFQELIVNRRSIRKYKTEAVSQEQIDKLLQAAMYAPSARNEQPWHFIVVTDRNMLNKIMQSHPYANMLKDAPLAVVVCADDTIEKTEGYWVQDCSAATQNILLAAKAMDLGSVWLGVYPREERILAISNLFNLPDNIHPLSIIAIGYPDEQKPVPLRYLEERIHNNQW
ncbi:MAG: nitroreductase family protein [Bacteroidales bacterium]